MAKAVLQQVDEAGLQLLGDDSNDLTDTAACTFTMRMQHLSNEYQQLKTTCALCHQHSGRLEEENAKLKARVAHLESLVPASVDPQVHIISDDTEALLCVTAGEFEDPPVALHDQDIAHSNASGFSKEDRNYLVKGGWYQKQKASKTVSHASEKGAGDFGRVSIETKERSVYREGCIIHPSNPYRMAWDIAGMVLLAYDLIYVPLLMSFQPDENPFTTAMEYVTLFFWTGDVVASLTTGYVDKGVTVMSPSRILKHYLMGWFWLDLVVVGPDWVFTVLEFATGSSSDIGNIGKMLRIMRAMRTLRLLRLAKLKKILASLHDLIDSEYMFILVNMASLIVMMLSVNHVITCIWYIVGTIGKSAKGPNWIDYHLEPTDDFPYRYTTSMHWSLTQFTPASMDVFPHNTGERTLAITVLIMGLMIFSSFISSITTSMTQLRAMQGQNAREIWHLRRFMKQRKVTPLLSFRIMRYVEHSLSRQVGLVPENKVALIPKLTDQLRHELTYEASFTPLLTHGLFEQITKVSMRGVSKLTDKGLKRKDVAVNELVFKLGEPVAHMIFITDGMVQYVDCKSSSRAHLEKEDWLCEACLWCDWTTKGEAVAYTESSFVQIDAAEFMSVMVAEPLLRNLAVSYAENFIIWLNTETTANDAFEAPSMKHTIAQFLAVESMSKSCAL